MGTAVTYRPLRPEDIETLVSMRLAFLAEVAGAEAADPALHDALHRYFSEYIPTGDFLAYLAVAGDGEVVGTSGMVYHRYPPSPANPCGVEAYVMNLYTLPAWRGRGIATELVRMLVEKARADGCGLVTLHALPMGKSVYRKAGFEPVETEMRLRIGRG